MVNVISLFVMSVGGVERLASLLCTLHRKITKTFLFLPQNYCIKMPVDKIFFIVFQCLCDI